MSQPLHIGSDSVPALPALQSTLHVSRTSETEQDGMPNVLVADPTGEHGIALPEYPDHLQYEASDTHSVNMQAEMKGHVLCYTADSLENGGIQKSAVQAQKSLPQKMELRW
jgi:hypothetical protein